MASAGLSAPIPAAPAGNGARPRWRDANSAVWPSAALAIVVLLQSTLVFTRAVNWDEFFYWHEVARFADGELARPLQTIHTRLFGWLPPLVESSVEGIVRARLFMLGCELLTLASIVLLARRFASPAAALLAALAYVTAAYVFQHGTSFRTDPMATAALMASLAILGTSRLRAPQVLAFGLLAGFAVMTSIKVVLYLPAFLGLAWLRWSEDDRSLRQLLTLGACGAAALSFFGLLYLWHSTGLAQPDEGLNQSSRLTESARGWVFFLGIPPYWKMALKSMATSPLLYACILAAPIVIARSARPMAEKLALAGLLLPMSTIFFYTNTAGYYYVFVLAPVAVAACVVIEIALRRYSAMFVAGILLIIGAGIWILEDRAVIDRQRQLVHNVDEIFDEPVPYIDQNLMLGSWPQVNGFMTPWGMSGYYASGESRYRRLLEQRTVPLLLANSEEWLTMLDGGEKGLLLAEDDEAIRANFRLFSWPIWVAGKEIPAGASLPREEFLVPGPYTIANGDLVFDGTLYEPGDVVTIERGEHAVANPGSFPAILTWGDNLRVPTRPVEPVHGRPILIARAMDVLFVTRKWPPATGGMETYSLRLTQALRELCPVEVVALPGRADGMPPRAIALLGFPFTVLVAYLRRAAAPKVLHLADMALWPLALPGMILWPDARVVLSAHGTDVAYHRRGGVTGGLYGAYLRIGARLLRKATVIANSRATRDVLAETGWRDVAVVPLAVDPVEIEGNIVARHDTILFAGRLVERKGCGWFVREVLPLLPEHLRLEVAGTVWDAGEGAALEHDRVTFLGPLGREDLARRYAEALCVIIPNIETASGEYEGFGLVAPEAAAARGVVLAADHGGLRDAVIDGETGFLLPIGEAAAWAAAIYDIVNWDDHNRANWADIATRAARN